MASETTLEYASIASLEEAERNPKEHSIGLIEDSITRFGFTIPLLVDENSSKLVAGHGRLKALRRLKSKGGEGTMACEACHPSEMRRLTIPELKRVSTFPDSFQLPGLYKEQWARIGNSVPPHFMRAIAEHIRNEILVKVEEAAHSSAPD